MRKRFLLLIPLLFIAAIAVSIFRYNSGSISGEEWFSMQAEYVDQLELVTEELSNVTSLYVAGSITQEDYQIHMETIRKEFLLLETNYKEKMDALHVKEDSVTYVIKKGVESVEDSFELVGELIEQCNDADVNSDTSNLSYVFLTAQEALEETMADYITSKAYLSDDMDSVIVSADEEADTEDSTEGTTEGE